MRTHERYRGTLFAARLRCDSLDHARLKRNHYIFGKHPQEIAETAEIDVIRRDARRRGPLAV
jgi:hypothetical protein